MEPKYLKLGDGTLIDTSNGKRSVSTEINKAFSDAPKSSVLTQSKKRSSYSEGKRRYLDDLPVPPDQSRAIAIVAAYTVFGLSEADISYILGQDVELIERVRQSEAYTQFVEAILQNVREHDQDKVRKKINDAAEKAAGKIVALADSKDEQVAFRAAKDVLDRAENGKYKTNENLSGVLTIRVIDDKEKPMEVEIA